MLKSMMYPSWRMIQPVIIMLIFECGSMIQRILFVVSTGSCTQTMGIPGMSLVTRITRYSPATRISLCWMGMRANLTRNIHSHKSSSNIPLKITWYQCSSPAQPSNIQIHPCPPCVQAYMATAQGP